MPRYWLIIAAVLLLATSACGSSSAEDSSAADFCTQSEQYVFFTDTFASAIDDPVTLERYMDSWEVRLNELVDVAPDDIEADLLRLRAGVFDVDATLDGVDYEVLQLTLQDLDSPEVSEASDNYLRYVGRECGVGPNAVDPDAPEVLTDDEVDAIQSDSPADLESMLAEQLSASLGLTAEEGTCLAAGISPEELLSVLEGDATVEASAELLATAETCGIDVEALTGEG